MNQVQNILVYKEGKRVATFVNGADGRDVPKGTARAILKQCGLK